MPDPNVEIVVVRDPSAQTWVSVYVDGVAADCRSVVIDAGHGWEWDDWRDFRDAPLAEASSPAYRAELIDAFDDPPGGEYVLGRDSTHWLDGVEAEDRLASCYRLTGPRAVAVTVPRVGHGQVATPTTCGSHDRPFRPRRQYTSWAFGQRIRAAGLLGSMGSIGDCFDNSMVKSPFGTLQLELLDRKAWATRQELANAIFDYIESFYNPARRHSKIGMLSPVEYEQAHTPAHAAA